MKPTALASNEWLIKPDIDIVLFIVISKEQLFQSSCLTL